MRAANRQPEADETGRRRDAARRARRLAEARADSMPVVEAIDGPRAVRVVEGPLEDPAPRGGIIEVLQQNYLLRLIVRRELAQMYAASALGLIWSYVQPAMRFFVYYFVMAVILHAHRSTPHFAVHLLTGLVFVHYFTETWSGGTRSIWSNRVLVLKMRMAREIFPVASMAVALYHTFPQIILLTVVCLLTGWHFSWTGAAAGVLGFLILAAFGMAMALYFSAINVFFRDFQNIVQTVTTFIHFLVPMMYPYTDVAREAGAHPVLYQIYMANPLTVAVLLMERFFWFGTIHREHKYANQFPPDLFERGIITVLISCVLLYGAQRYFARVENKFPERL
ncbi:MAG: ABC transporter permease [Actinomycetota bacterium]|nr:ABC transporter permease [Actinomycetota bacterium]